MEKMMHGYQNVWYSCIRCASVLNSAKFNCANVSWRSIKKPYSVVLNRIESTPVLSCIYIWQ